MKGSSVTVVLAFKSTGSGKRVREGLLAGAPNSVITTCVIRLGTSPPFTEMNHTLSLHTPPRDAVRTQLLPPTVSQGPWDPWPQGAPLWLSWLGICLTPSRKPSPSMLVFGSAGIALLPTCSMGKVCEAQRSSLPWPPVQGYEAAPLPPNATVLFCQA